MSTKLSDYAYTFPPELIALAPCNERDGSRLLFVNQKTKALTHELFKNIEKHFVSGDILVLNNSQVFPCRLLTERKTGGKQEIFLIRKVENQNTTLVNTEIWEVLLGPNSKVNAGDVFTFNHLKVTVLNNPHEPRLAKLEFTGDIFEILQKIAHVPLPSYIKRADTPEDITRYQTVFAKNLGSVAAPTAGLHFTETLLEKLKNQGVEIVYTTLHVGLGTFLPVKTENILEHKMHEEVFAIEPQSWHKLVTAKKQGRRITAVGTTTVRVLETLAHAPEKYDGGWQRTAIFIHPPYTFKMVDRLITNFHQSESTLLMLVSAFAGREFILSAYEEAIKERYRLFSYGDAMMIE